MKKIFLGVVLVLCIIGLVACTGGEKPVIQESPQQIAEKFVRNDVTFLFDGIPETLRLAAVTALPHGGVYTYEFDSRHAGYGDRTGQVLAQVLTHHIAVVTVENGEVTSAVMDDIWDMQTSRMRQEMEISPAPIHEVNVSLLMSNPPQVSVFIRGGLRDGGTRFHGIEVSRQGTVIDIAVTTMCPKEGFFPAVYGYFEKEINLGSEFSPGITYTLRVNDYTTTFSY
ncbi:MAG: hypothetical protein N2506_04220 [Dehalococcoidales bacterium]|nr:hypothetical protein [Dehalococcoidales bacterium]